MRTPIALMTYNRLDTLKETIESLKWCNHVDEHDCVIFSDGPNFRKKDDKKKIQAIREYLIFIKNENIFKSTELVFRERNLGCKDSVINSINYMFSRHNRVIDVEDDLLLSKGFLDYMDEALDFFENRKNVGSVAGFSHPLKSVFDNPQETYMALRTCSWGFGTWADRWMDIDWEINDFDCLNNDAWEGFSKYGYDLPEMLRMQVEENIDTWDIQWAYSMYKNGRYTVYPKYTLVQNIGSYGTHLKGEEISQQDKRAEFINPDFNRCYISEPIIKEMREMVKSKEEFLNSSYDPYDKGRRYYRLLNRWLMYKEESICLETFFIEKSIQRIAIYGFSDIGRHIYEEIKRSNIEIRCFIDRNPQQEEYLGIPIYKLEDDIPVVDAVVVAPFIEYRKIKDDLKEKFDNKTEIISIETVIFH